MTSRAIAAAHTAHSAARVRVFSRSEITRHRNALQQPRDESGGLVGHTGAYVGAVGGNVFTSKRAHRVVGSAQVDRARPPDRADRNRQFHLRSRVAEQRDRCDEVGGVRRQRVVESDGWEWHRRDDVDHCRTLGVAAQHQPGARAVGHHVLDVRTGVVGAARGREEVEGSRIVHGVGADRSAPDLTTQRVDEGLAYPAEAGRIVCAAGEHDLDVRAALCGGGRCDCRADDRWREKQYRGGQHGLGERRDSGKPANLRDSLHPGHASRGVAAVRPVGPGQHGRADLEPESSAPTSESSPPATPLRWHRGSELLQPTTRLQVSGHRFLVRRMEHALVRGDARMLDDPLRAQSISLAAGGLLATVIVAVCAILALVRPAGEVGDAAIVVVRDTGATYVRIGDVLHPVFNMASARLIAGAPADPRMVDQRAVDSAHRGPQLGIPGAPVNISTPLTAEESTWTICDDAGGETVVIAGRIAETVVRARSGVLVTPRDGSAATTYLLYGSRRARVDLRHPAVVRALRLDGVVPQPISAAILSAIPEAPEIAPPHIPEAGAPGPRMLRDYPAGSVLKVARANADSAEDYFVVLADGVQRIGEVTADLIRYTDSHVGGQIPTVAPDLIADVPVRDTLPVRTFPESSGVGTFPVVCARWRAGPAGGDASSAILVGDAAPLISHPAALAQADADGPAVDAVAIPPGRSVFARSVGLTGAGRGAGSLFLITDTGVLYGIRDSEAAGSLGLTAPAQPAPWPVLSALPHGPELSRRDASVARDGLVVSPKPSHRR